MRSVGPPFSITYLSVGGGVKMKCHRQLLQDGASFFGDLPFKCFLVIPIRAKCGIAHISSNCFDDLHSIGC